MRTHELKSWPPLFDDVLAGRKRFEVRKNDRDYEEGDEVLLREWRPDLLPEDANRYTGRSVRLRIRYVFEPHPGRDPFCGLLAGYCVLDLE
jgi:hypothetical protein